MLMLLLISLGLSACLTQAVPRIKREPAPGPLYDYVHRVDGAYGRTEYDSIVQDGYTTYFLNLTSQRWYDETVSNRPVWWHYLVVHIPNTIRYPDAGALYISTGSNLNNPPNLNDYHTLKMGEYTAATGIITGVIKLVPNQPIIMENDGVPRVEDDFIAWTWKRYYDEQVLGIDNPEILARMPMCKASVKAMDAIQEIAKAKRSVDIENFMISGQSKRGWTAWLVAAVDARVVAMAPTVLSCLNMNPNFHHYYRSFGGWPFAMFDYWNFGILGLFDEPEIESLAKIIDPYEYREYLTMPKLMISGSSDEFFLLDDYDYFYRDFLGEKYIWLIENAGHTVTSSPSGEEYWKMLQTFYISVLDDQRMPYIDWTRTHTEEGGSIIFLSQTRPHSISVWSAPSVVPHRRDWRKAMLDSNNNPVETGIEWTEGPVEDLGNGYYRAYFDNPPEGYLAFFIKAIFDAPGGRSYYFTSEANIVPNNWPYEACEGAQCLGILV